MGKKRIGLFTPPLEKAGIIPFSNLLDLISPFSHDISIISGNEELFVIQKDNIRNYKILFHSTGKSQFSRILKFFFFQLKISFYFLKFNKNVDVWFFFLGGEIYILPMMLTRLLNKPVFCILTSSASLMLSHDRYLFFINYLAKTGYFFANKILIYSPRLISEWNLEPYRNKIMIAHEHFLDLEAFKIMTPLSDRPPLIGYIGRLSAEKGVQHFLKALPIIFNDRNDLRVLIVGDGHLKESIETTINEEKISNRVELTGWISHTELPEFLNQLQLLVLPSFTEGLPNIMLEAMACGTMVLATPVGAIPDSIRDGETGFIMQNNSPECIAKNTIRAMSSPDRERIAKKGRQFVEENYTFEKTLENWRKILDEI
jgi:glycosyltransferase involved in cell wall biosynthesis